MQSELASWKLEERPHCAWLCVQADSARIFGEPDEPDEAKRLRGTEGELGRLLNRPGIPVIVVITQADRDGPEVEAMRRRRRQVFDFPHSVVPDCAQPRTPHSRILIPAHGLDILKSEALKILPAPLAERTARGWVTRVPPANR